MRMAMWVRVAMWFRTQEQVDVVLMEQILHKPSQLTSGVGPDQWRQARGFRRVHGAMPTCSTVHAQVTSDMRNGDYKGNVVLICEGPSVHLMMDGWIHAVHAAPIARGLLQSSRQIPSETGRK